MASSHASSRRPNVLATGISLIAIGVLYANTNPETSGADPSELLGGGQTSVSLSIAPALSYTMPPDTVASPEAVDASSDDATATTAAAPAGPVPSVTGRIALVTHILMLEKARDAVANYPAYVVNFHKRERIDGELHEPQSIQMEVRHEPFSIYMKWLNFDKGRRLKFVPAEQDGKAQVKLGGLKGRLLPAISIEPNGSRAMAESRYPVTKAGILPMIDDMLAYRRDDLEKRTGLKCELYENVEVNGKTCYGFVVRYPDQATSSLYRWSVTYLDKDTFIPVRLTNYTWARDAENLSPGELDEQTLIEDYAFSDLQVRNLETAQKIFSRKL